MYLSLKTKIWIFVALWVAIVVLLFAQAWAQNPGFQGGGGGGSGGGGGVTVNVKSFGAQGNGQYVFDATSQGLVMGQGVSVGGSTTPTAPSITTLANNDTIVTVFGLGAGPFTPPASSTSRVNIALTPVVNYGLYLGDQTQVTAGATGAISGSTSSSQTWAGINMALKGNPSFVNSTSGTSGASSPTTTLAWPSGTSAGQEALACFSYFATATDTDTLSGTGVTLFGGTPVINSNSGANNLITTCYARTVTGTESGNYAFTCSANPCYATGTIAVYGPSSFDGANTITSNTANWNQSNTGNMICAPAGFAATNPPSPPSTASTQQCGTISTVVNSTTIIPSFTTVTDATPSEIGFAHNDTAAFTSAITALQNLSPPGGTLYIPAGGYGITPNTIVMPTNAVINLLGAGASLHDYFEPSATFKSVPLSGSTLMVLAATPAGPAITYPYNANGSDLWQWTTVEQLSNLGIWCGEGTTQDGGGGDGIDIAWDHLDLNHFSVANCSGNGILINANYPRSIQGTAGDSLHVFYSIFNNLGLRITGAASTGANQQVYVTEGEIDNNTTYGVEVDTAQASGLHFDEDINQWNNQGGANPGYEWNFAAPCLGCSVSNTWTEDEKANTNGVLFGTSDGQAPSFTNDFFQITGSNSSVFNGTFVDGFELTNSFFFSGTTPFNSGLTTFFSTITNTSRASGDGFNGVFAHEFNGTSGTALCWANMTGGISTLSCNLVGYANTGAAQTFSMNPFVSSNVNFIYSDNCPTNHGNSASTTTLTLPTGSTAQTCLVTASGAGGANGTGYIMSGSASGALPTATADFDFSGSSTSGNIGAIQQIMPKAVTLSGWFCTGTALNGNTSTPGAGGWNITVVQNKANTAVLCFVPPGSTTCTDTVDTLTANPGDTFYYVAYPGGSPSATPTQGWMAHCSVSISG